MALWREAFASSVANRADGRSQIDTFSAAGQRLGIAKRNTDNLLDIGWSYDEHLLCLCRNGRVSVDDMYGNSVKNISFGSDVDQAGVAECKFFVNNRKNSGIVALTNSAKFYVIENINDPQTIHVHTESMHAPAHVRCDHRAGVLYPVARNISLLLAKKTFLISPFRTVSQSK